MFLKKARSVLKMAGSRIRFLCKLPIAPGVPGLAKQEVSIRYGEPSGANVPGRRFGSQMTTGRALMSPPLKSVMFVAEGVPAKVQFRPVPVPNVLGLPLAAEVVPETCQWAKTGRATRVVQCGVRV